MNIEVLEYKQIYMKQGKNLKNLKGDNIYSLKDQKTLDYKE